MEEVALIMAGGSGQRFWPKSRTNLPKQLLSLDGEKSLLQLCYERMNSIYPKEHVFIIAGEKYKDTILSHLKGMDEKNYISEPEGRDTAAAIALAVNYLQKLYHNPTISVVAADHIIKNIDKFGRVIRAANIVARDYSCIITLGIKPLYPHTGYGYINIGNEITNIDGIRAYEVVSFKEKPDRKLALKYLESGNYLWNSGMFVFSSSVFMEQLSMYYPKLFETIIAMDEMIAEGKIDKAKEMFKALPKISIDYAVIEKSKAILSIKADFDWIDIGSWDSIYRFNQKDENKNVVYGNVIVKDAKNSMIMSDNKNILGAVIGVDNVIVVITDDAVLVCSRDSDQKVKEVVKMMAEDDRYKSFI